MSGIYPKAQAPVTEVTAEYAAERARRWQVRYDEAMDMALVWQQRYVEIRKELNELKDSLEQPTEGRHKASPPHPNTMIGRKTHGERDHHPAD